MWIIRYRTHGPWQQEALEEGDESEAEHNNVFFNVTRRANELSREYGEVTLERYESYGRWKNGLELS